MNPHYAQDGIQVNQYSFNFGQPNISRVVEWVVMVWTLNNHNFSTEGYHSISVGSEIWVKNDLELLPWECSYFLQKGIATHAW